MFPEVTFQESVEPSLGLEKLTARISVVEVATGKEAILYEQERENLSHW